MTRLEWIKDHIIDKYKVGDIFTSYDIYSACKIYLTSKDNTRPVSDGTINHALSELKKKDYLMNRDPNMSNAYEREMIHSKRQKIWYRI